MADQGDIGFRGGDVGFERWLSRNALHLVVALLVAVFGWSVDATLGGIARDISANTARLERLDEGLRGVLVDQASHARRIEDLGRRLDHLERRMEGRDGGR